MNATISPTLSYSDAHAAIDFLERAFGFERGEVHTDDEGRVAHAELWFRGSCVMLGTADTGSSPDPGANGAIYVVVEDADAHHARAAAAGAEVSGLSEQDYGSRDFHARDPEGNLWYFGTYLPSPPASQRRERAGAA
jgi:uncharacterized glyoxalase superfamily protein PhnB